jgi:hypothetical protein
VVVAASELESLRSGEVNDEVVAAIAGC